MAIQARDLLVCILTLVLNFIIGETATSFDVTQFEAVGDGKTDDAPAFLKAWEAACAAQSTPTLTIPSGKKFLLGSTVLFQGPCKSSSVIIQVSGDIVASTSTDWNTGNENCWLCFSGIPGLTIQGSGTINGQGSSWWQGQATLNRPRAMFFLNCNNFILKEITIQNSPRIHIAITQCNGGTISNIKIDTPGDSPNTDGINIERSSQIKIQDSTIGCGDDCIALKGGANNINISGIACGPGHGISVGSLGDGETEDQVEKILVRNCNFTQTQNGVRIKTIENGTGFARNITFQDITLIKTQNPIIIDQHYKDNSKQTSEGLKISDISYISIQGTSGTEVAIKLDCNTNICSNIVMEDVQITPADSKLVLRSICNNANGTATSTSPEVSCLQSS